MLPSHTSEKLVFKTSELPTAAQADAELHDTLDKTPPDSPETVGVGVFAIAQAAREHLGQYEREVAEVGSVTAVQLDAATDDTLVKASPLEPVGLAVFSIVQVAPFHTSANVSSLDVLS